MADGGASIGRSAENPRVDRVGADHRSINHARAFLRRVIMATIECAETHRDRRLAIRRAPFDAFYNAYRQIESGASIKDQKALI